MNEENQTEENQTVKHMASVKDAWDKAVSLLESPRLTVIGRIKIRQRNQPLIVIEGDQSALKRDEPAFAEFPKDAVDVDGT